MVSHFSVASNTRNVNSTNARYPSQFGKLVLLTNCKSVSSTTKKGK